jgi:hypothetical protein
MDRRFSLANPPHRTKVELNRPDVSLTAPPGLPKALPSPPNRRSLVSKIGQQSSSLWKNWTTTAKRQNKCQQQENFYSSTDVNTIMKREMGKVNDDDDRHYQKIDGYAGGSRKYLELIGSGNSCASSVKYEAILSSNGYEEARECAIDGEYDNFKPNVGGSEQYLKLTSPSEQYLRLDDSSSTRYEKVDRDDDGGLVCTENYDDLPDSPSFGGLTSETSIAESLRSELMECINPLFANRFAEFHRPPFFPTASTSSDGVVVARLAVVRDQEESLNYVYENEDGSGNNKRQQRAANQGYETIVEEKPSTPGANKKACCSNKADRRLSTANTANVDSGWHRTWQQSQSTRSL